MASAAEENGQVSLPRMRASDGILASMAATERVESLLAQLPVIDDDDEPDEAPAAPPMLRRDSPSRSASNNSHLSVHSDGGNSTSPTPPRRRSFFTPMEPDSDGGGEFDNLSFMPFTAEQDGLEPLKAVISTLHELMARVDARATPSDSASAGVDESATSLNVSAAHGSGTTVEGHQAKTEAQGSVDRLVSCSSQMVYIHEGEEWSGSEAGPTGAAIDPNGGAAGFARGIDSGGSTGGSTPDREIINTLKSCIASLETIFQSGLFEIGLAASTQVRSILRTRLDRLLRQGDEGRAVASWVENTFAEGILAEDDDSFVEVQRSVTEPPSRGTSEDDFTDILKGRASSVQAGTTLTDQDADLFRAMSLHRNSKLHVRDSQDSVSRRPFSRLGRSQSVKERHSSSYAVGRQKRPFISGPVFSTACENLLSHAVRWDMNIFKLDVLSQGRPLTALGMKLFNKTGLIGKFKIPPLVLTHFFIAVEDEYHRRDAVPYHNNIHGADVMHSTYVLLSDRRMKDRVSDLEMLAALLAAAVHDVAHPGLTNQFLIETGHDIAMLYNDKSVLENYHCATAFRLMSDAKLDVLATLSKEDRISVRKMMIAMVLGTDMAQHFQHLAEFRSVVDALGTTEKKDAEGGSSRHLNVVGRTSSGGQADKMGFPDMDQKVLMCAVVHLADMGNPTKPWEICTEWTFSLLREFFAQGDLEKKEGIAVGPLHDRQKVNIPKSQIGFIDFIVLPLWETWDSFVGDAVMFENLCTNREKWSEMAEEKDGAEKAAARVHGGPLSPVHFPDAGNRRPCLDSLRSLRKETSGARFRAAVSPPAESSTAAAAVAPADQEPLRVAARPQSAPEPVRRSPRSPLLTMSPARVAPASLPRTHRRGVVKKRSFKKAVYL